jgi:hypothetical protein
MIWKDVTGGTIVERRLRVSFAVAQLLGIAIDGKCRGGE